MKKLIVFVVFSLLNSLSLYSQSYNQDQKVLANTIERMYNSSPFEGCRFFDDYDHSYLLSVVSLDKNKYKTEQAMNRVAEVKSQRQAGEFFNGTQTIADFVIKSPKCEGKDDNQKLVETYEEIRTHSMGYIQQMQLLCSFTSKDSIVVFVFSKIIK